MAPPKKMSLQEFFSDESYGGSWADEEIDIASISVPIEKNRGHGSGSSYSSFGNNGYGSSSSFIDNGPPYIIKLSNIPVTSNDAFVEDLFRSRFTPFIKFKILFDPSSQPLESGIIRKIAFVELKSFEHLTRVSKWQDVVYKGTRRVMIEPADFNDFQYSMAFNRDNEAELLIAERAFLADRGRYGNHDDGLHRGRPRGRGPGGMPLDDIPLPHHRSMFGRGSRDSGRTPLNSSASSVQHSVSNQSQQATRVKPNPFGNAKPVDTPSNVLKSTANSNINMTNVPAPLVQPRPWNGTDKSSTSGTVSKDGQMVSSSQSSHKQSLADILSKENSEEHIKAVREAKLNALSQSPLKKPIILKKKSVPTPEPASAPEASKTPTSDPVIENSLASTVNAEPLTDQIPNSKSAGSSKNSKPESSSGVVVEKPINSVNRDSGIQGQTDHKNQTEPKEKKRKELPIPTKAHERPDFKNNFAEMTQGFHSKTLKHRRRSEQSQEKPSSDSQKGGPRDSQSRPHDRSNVKQKVLHKQEDKVREPRVSKKKIVAEPDSSTSNKVTVVELNTERDAKTSSDVTDSECKSAGTDTRGEKEPGKRRNSSNPRPVGNPRSSARKMSSSYDAENSVPKKPSKQRKESVSKDSAHEKNKVENSSPEHHPGTPSGSHNQVDERKEISLQNESSRGSHRGRTRGRGRGRGGSQRGRSGRRQEDGSSSTNSEKPAETQQEKKVVRE